MFQFPTVRFFDPKFRTIGATAPCETAVVATYVVMASDPSFGHCGTLSTCYVSQPRYTSHLPTRVAFSRPPPRIVATVCLHLLGGGELLHGTRNLIQPALVNLIVTIICVRVGTSTGVTSYLTVQPPNIPKTGALAEGAGWQLFSGSLFNSFIDQHTLAVRHQHSRTPHQRIVDLTL